MTKRVASSFRVRSILSIDSCSSKRNKASDISNKKKKREKNTRDRRPCREIVTIVKTPRLRNCDVINRDCHGGEMMRSKDREHNGETKSVHWLPSCIREARKFRDNRGNRVYLIGDFFDTFELIVRAVTWCLGEPGFLQGRDGLHLVLAAIDLTTFHWGRILQQLRTRRHFRQQCRAMRRMMSCTLANSSFRQRSPRSSRLSLSPHSFFLPISYAFYTLRRTDIHV